MCDQRRRLERVRTGQMLAVEAALERITQAREAVEAIPGVVPEGLLADLQGQEDAIREAEPVLREAAEMYQLLVEAGQHLSGWAGNDPSREVTGLLQSIAHLRERVENAETMAKAVADG